MYKFVNIENIFIYTYTLPRIIMSTDNNRQYEKRKTTEKKSQLNQPKSLLEQDSSNIIQSHQENEDSKMQQEIEEDQENQQVEQQYEDQGQYRQYGEYGEYGEYMLEESMETYGKRVFSECNTQYQMEDLVKIIDKEVEKVKELSGFSRQWALIYYQTCGWKMDLVHGFIDQKKSSFHMINYTPTKTETVSKSGICQVCCLQDQIIYKNLCGHQFCQQCWKAQLTQRMRTYNTYPFPPCLDEDCQVRISPFISEQIAKNDPIFKKLYYITLCRSYAMGSTSVKMCKGRQKYSCDRCFKISKIFEMLECQNCGNLVCARCGQQYHIPSQCYDGINWRKIVQQSTNFIQNLNYRVCPYCKQAVQRSSGCNSLKCKCKQMFCYICEQKWLPNHSQHGVCYKQKQIKALLQQGKKKSQNQEQYIDKLEKFKAQVQNYKMKLKIIEGIDVAQIKGRLVVDFKIISNELDYLQPLSRKLKVALLIGKNYVLSLYFRDNQVMKAQLTNLQDLIQNSYDYFTSIIPSIIEAFGQKFTYNVGKKAAQMRKGNLNPVAQLAKYKLQMLSNINKFDKYISY